MPQLSVNTSVSEFERHKNNMEGLKSGLNSLSSEYQSSVQRITGDISSMSFDDWKDTVSTTLQGGLEKLKAKIEAIGKDVSSGGFRNLQTIVEKLVSKLAECVTLRKQLDDKERELKNTQSEYNITPKFIYDSYGNASPNPKRDELARLIATISNEINKLTNQLRAAVEVCNSSFSQMTSIVFNGTSSSVPVPVIVPEEDQSVVTQQTLEQQTPGQQTSGQQTSGQQITGQQTSGQQVQDYAGQVSETEDSSLHTSDANDENANNNGSDEETKINPNGYVSMADLNSETNGNGVKPKNDGDTTIANSNVSVSGVNQPAVSSTTNNVTSTSGEKSSSDLTQKLNDFKDNYNGNLMYLQDSGLYVDVNKDGKFFASRSEYPEQYDFSADSAEEFAKMIPKSSSSISNPKTELSISDKINNYLESGSDNYLYLEDNGLYTEKGPNGKIYARKAPYNDALITANNIDELVSKLTNGKGGQ